MLPLPRDAIKKIDKSTSPMHIGKLANAIDLVADIGTPVLAAADGTVTFVKDDSYSGGPTIDYLGSTNFIVIKHKNNEYTRYDHLAHKSSLVRCRQLVQAGQVIARVGTTGFTFLPHLHFQAFVITGPNIWTDFETLIVDSFD